MREHGNWSLPLGHWGGVTVRLHLFFVLFVAGIFYWAWAFGQQHPDSPTLLYTVLGLNAYLLSLVAHEFGHLLAVAKLEGSVDEVVIGPFGGMTASYGMLEPQSEMLVYLGGPFANLFVAAVFCLPVLMAQTDAATISGLLNPLAPERLLSDQSWLTVVKMTFWINWVLFGVNLLPVSPLDGGRTMRAAIITLWPDVTRRRAGEIMSLASKCCAVLLTVAAVLAFRQLDAGPLPTWFAVLLLAIFIFFNAVQDDATAEMPADDESLFGYDFSQGYTSLERSERDTEQQKKQTSGITRWLADRREAREQRQREIEADEESRVDGILARLHEVGLEKLTPEERSLLQRVSARYRNRNKA